MKNRSFSLLSLLLLFNVSKVALAGDGEGVQGEEHKFYTLRYGPQQSEQKFEKSPEFIGLKPYKNKDTDNLASWLGEEGKKLVDIRPLGGFRLLKFKEKKTLDERNEDLNTIRNLSTVHTGTHAYCLTPPEAVDTATPLVPTGIIYIEFKQDHSNIGTYTQYLETFKLEIEEVRGAYNLVTRVTEESYNPLRVAYSLQNDKPYSDFVTVAEPEFATMVLAKGFTRPNDALLKEQWHLQNTGNHRGTEIGLKEGADARVVDAWNEMKGYGSSKITVAVIDDGFDLNHPDLKGENKIVYPWDFERQINDPSPKSFDPRYGDWHGTACAGVAVGNLGEGNIIGAAPMAKLMPLRWGIDLSDTKVEKWFSYAARNGADVISCSWGAEVPYFPLSTRIFKALEKCATIEGREGKGCVIVFAAGNSNHDINNPAGRTLDGFATHPNVIAVAASSSIDKKSHYSNFGKEIAVCAPSSGAGGMKILTSDVTGSYSQGGESHASGYNYGDYTYSFGGTSSACPLVAGVSALVLSCNSDLTSGMVKELLQKTARKIDREKGEYQDGHSKFYGYGCVNAAEAVKEALSSKKQGRIGEPISESEQNL